MFERFKFDKKPVLNLNNIQLNAKQSIEKKIDKKNYTFEDVKCIQCEHNNFEKIAEKDRYGLYFPVVICKECGLVQTNPRMTQDSYNEFYNDEYRPLYVGYDTPTQIFFERQFNKAKSIFNFFTNHQQIPMDRLIVEIGCGAGGILDFFRKKGYDVIGNDLGEEYINFGKEQHGLDLQTGTLDDLKLPENKKIGLIIYSHVLEHILNPYEELLKIRDLIDENTLVYIEVPGIKNIHNNYEYDILKYFQNAHTYHFSKSSLSNLLKKSGFEIIEANEYIRSLSKIGKKSQSHDYVNDYQDTINYINNTEKNRYKIFLDPGFYKLRIGKILIKILELLGLRKIVREIRKKAGV